ncbi:MAG: hypothetical protein ABH870_09190, partial [bacterium]
SKNFTLITIFFKKSNFFTPNIKFLAFGRITMGKSHSHRANCFIEYSVGSAGNGSGRCVRRRRKGEVGELDKNF